MSNSSEKMSNSSEKMSKESASSSQELSGSESEEEWIEKTNYSSGLYIVYCDKYTVSELRDYLEKCGGNENSIVGPIRVQYNKQHYKNKETNRNICILSKDIFNAMLELGHSTKTRNENIGIARYHLKQKEFPKKYEQLIFYIKLPTNNSVNFYRKKIQSKLDKLIEVKLLNCEYEIDIPIKNRSKGQHYGRAFVKFKKSEYSRSNRVEIVLTKVALSESLWDSKSNMVMFINWYHDEVNQTNRTNKRHEHRETRDEHMFTKKRTNYKNSKPIPIESVILNEKINGDDVLRDLEKHYDQQ